MLFKVPKPKILLDTNAVRYCFGREGFDDATIVRLRERMLELSERDDCRFVVTQPVSWELTKFRFEAGSREFFAELLRFYTTIGRRWAMQHEWDRVRDELRYRRRLRRNEVFGEIDLADLEARFDNDAHLRSVYENQLDLKCRERDEETTKRERLVEAVAENLEERGLLVRTTRAADLEVVKAKLRDEVFNLTDRIIANYVKLEMRNKARELNLKLRGAAWPRPRDVPTLWYGEAFFIAKARTVFVDTNRGLTTKGSVKAMPDLLDATHFRDAAYADVLVTQDENFRIVAAKANQPLQVLSFDEFAHAVLA